ncbi:MAG: hypothetical protein OEX07_15200, partial [Gammaproteobacteria bacterium]|nr:hypothetical protein [Gammaproteobacteria bacterium]
MSLNDFNLRIPYPDVFPPVWGSKLPGRDTMLFRNLDHFIYEVSHLTQKEDQKCGMSYAAALDLLKRRQSDFPETRQAEIRNLVRSNLHKRGLISEETYEAYRYSVDGTQVGVDVGKYANGEADCVITPARHYVDFFHELYVSISYPWNVENKEVRENTAKLLATVEELERQHIFIKITLVLPISGAKNNGSHFFSSIPL